MAKKGKSTNPFYIVLVVAGVLFAITACGYGVMTVRLASPQALIQQTSESTDNSFVLFFEDYGFTLMLVELAVLGIGTFAAIGTDDYWQQRGEKRAEPFSPPRNNS